MTPVELSRTVLHAVRRAVDEGELRVAALPERVLVAPPGPGGCGDYATNVALQLARPAGLPAQKVADVLRPYLLSAGGIGDVVVTGPGFLNISLRGTAPVDLVREVLRRGLRYGHGDALAGRVVRLNAAREVRAVVQIDAVARLLRSQGALVHAGCAGPLDAAWESVLGVRVDGVPDPVTPIHDDTAAAIDVRPVPAPADPLPLGRDAARWALLHPAPHDRPRLGDEHLVQRESNPLFRVRYAHARSRSLVRNAADLGFGGEPGPVEAQALLQALADHPRVLLGAATHRAPDRLARHLVTVADALLPLLPAVLPLGDEKPSAAHRARLALAEAAGTVLAGGLSLLGIDAPDHL
ncbi:arginyl-tRNA synthetase [Streptomyces toyocaensis]|uniref:arginine--tRNA ligase n=1 Tax=Streptomyces toyocaensis TaxID=55952 RepID=A0A081XPI4_STRTO|nr:DALR anticodon-binding domain-containing protein [Streptomyces toyocaensis]KES05457.1 arginyl-tRNA synthetase [Streptomyces toyocaensis]